MDAHFILILMVGFSFKNHSLLGKTKWGFQILNGWYFSNIYYCTKPVDILKGLFTKSTSKVWGVLVLSISYKSGNSTCHKLLSSKWWSTDSRPIWLNSHVLSILCYLTTSQEYLHFLPWPLIDWTLSMATISIDLSGI